MPFGNPASKRIDSDALSSVLRLIQGGKCIVTAIRGINTSTAVAHIQLYDAAASTAVTDGVTVPDWTVRCAGSSPSDGDGLPTTGLLFENGVVAAASPTQTTIGSATVEVHTKICVI